MRLRRTAIAFAHPRRAVQRAVDVVAGAHASTTAARSPRHWAARSRHCIGNDTGKTATAKWRRHHDRRLHRGGGRTDAECVGGGRQKSCMAAGRRWRGERARSSQRMFFHLECADHDRFAIVISVDRRRCEFSNEMWCDYRNILYSTNKEAAQDIHIRL